MLSRGSLPPPRAGSLGLGSKISVALGPALCWGHHRGWARLQQIVSLVQSLSGKCRIALDC